MEPYVGSGAVVLGLLADGHLEGKDIYLLDGAQNLIELWQLVAGPSDQAFDILLANYEDKIAEHRKSEDHAKRLYFEERAKYYDTPFERAVQLLYLNSACYNGVYRHNKKGTFNVPIGKTFQGSFAKYPVLKSRTLHNAREAFLKAQNTGSKVVFRYALSQDGFKYLHNQGRFNDAVVYLDPPYHTTFSNYIPAGFKLEEHIALADFHKSIWNRGGRAYQTNADTPEIRTLYQGCQMKLEAEIESVQPSAISRGAVPRLMIGAPSHVGRT